MSPYINNYNTYSYLYPQGYIWLVKSFLHIPFYEENIEKIEKFLNGEKSRYFYDINLDNVFTDSKLIYRKTGHFIPFEHEIWIILKNVIENTSNKKYLSGNFDASNVTWSSLCEDSRDFWRFYKEGAPISENLKRYKKAWDESVIIKNFLEDDDDDDISEIEISIILCENEYIAYIILGKIIFH